MRVFLSRFLVCCVTVSLVLPQGWCCLVPQGRAAESDADSAPAERCCCCPVPAAPVVPSENPDDPDPSPPPGCCCTPESATAPELVSLPTDSLFSVALFAPTTGALFSGVAAVADLTAPPVPTTPRQILLCVWLC